MDYDQTNTLIYEALESLAPLATAKASMFPTDDKYGHPPFLRFRFKNKNKNDTIYHNIKYALERLNGRVKWELYEKPDTENYLIIPVFFERLNTGIRFYDKEVYLALLGKELYYKKIDEALDDIPALAEMIKKSSSLPLTPDE
ncbi:hypothetical protein [Arsenicibacter rosenii]|uniref:Uncharacterized protein n=1 Tax=Arsenicibacter rosenii TaxID=1750698 RepID=A0A1S2VAC2_9BACT|nr:hypothetical protein [Arsenicibacter rosenii]OIN55609.1 hypothetical protein BLX24_29145 [Arsenicibacter rosenii]